MFIYELDLMKVLFSLTKCFLEAVYCEWGAYEIGWIHLQSWAGAMGFINSRIRCSPGQTPSFPTHLFCVKWSVPWLSVWNGQFHDAELFHLVSQTNGHWKTRNIHLSTLTVKLKDVNPTFKTFFFLFIIYLFIRNHIYK